MTAPELKALAKDAATRAQRFEHLTNQAQTTGMVFDPMAPLPTFPDYRARSWEPAARHYIDLTDAEKQAMQATHD